MDTKQLEQLANDYAVNFNTLRDSVESLNWEIEELKSKHMGSIRTAVQAVKTQQSILERAINQCQDCFTKPRTLTFHGIKIGFQKKKGTINFADNSIELIKTRLGKHEHNLIMIKESISKTFAAQLSVADIRKIGGEVVADSDVIVIKSVDSNVDKMVNQLLDANDKDIKL